MSITYAEYRAVRSIISGQATTHGPTTPSESNYDDGPGVTDIDCVVVLQEKVKRVLSQTVKASARFRAPYPRPRYVWHRAPHP